MKKNGFSLVELLIGLVVLGVGFKIALPNMTQWSNGRRASAVAQSIVDGLRLARQEALSRNTNVNFSFDTSDTAGNIFWDVGCAQTIAAQTVGTSVALIGCPAQIWTRRLFASGDAFDITRAPTATSALNTMIIQFQPLGTVAATSMTNLANSGTAIRLPVTYRGTATPYAVNVTAGGVIKVCNTTISTAGDPLLCINA